MNDEQTPAEKVLDLMHNTQWTIGEWCAHLTDDEMGLLRASGRVDFWAFSGLDEHRGGVSTCIISAEVLAAAKRVAADLPQWSDLTPVDFRVGGDG